MDVLVNCQVFNRGIARALYLGVDQAFSREIARAFSQEIVQAPYLEIAPAAVATDPVQGLILGQDCPVDRDLMDAQQLFRDLVVEREIALVLVIAQAIAPGVEIDRILGIGPETALEMVTVRTSETDQMLETDPATDQIVRASTTVKIT
ncbi:hypothetical protein Mal48_14560 [Thalassoglobus polymorphus]|uniref:Uncharacterized protein n=1 Tax=Thalassoglobus polymorphus TaxID=2527994 RepID=A0A517QKT7_9PLAN|nr:hypothetical protein Mal48_14560 [Thalassoglobus polymorphus]